MILLLNKEIVHQVGCKISILYNDPRSKIHQSIKSWLRGNVTGLFGVLSVCGPRVKGMIRLRPEQVWTCNVARHHRPLLCRSFHF
jgi:hypothetical protein